jgi:hypothetical protein
LDERCGSGRASKLLRISCAGESCCERERGEEDKEGEKARSVKR